MEKGDGERGSEEDDEEVNGLNEEGSEGRHFRFWLTVRESGYERGGEEDKGGRYCRRSSVAWYPSSLPLAP